ncbi:hypothetical protein AVEN_87057-1, partial [Araneus ventricosus]
ALFSRRAHNLQRFVGTGVRALLRSPSLDSLAYGVRALLSSLSVDSLAYGVRALLRSLSVDSLACGAELLPTCRATLLPSSNNESLPSLDSRLGVLLTTNHKPQTVGTRLYIDWVQVSVGQLGVILILG